MAESSTAYSTEKFSFCIRYMKRNHCPRGNTCPYKHCQESNIIIIRKPAVDSEFVIGQYRYPPEMPAPRRRIVQPVICHYYLRGYCQYGSRCKFAHPTPILKASDDPRIDQTSQPSTSQSGSTASTSSSEEEEPQQKDNINIPREYVVKEVNKALNLPHTLTSGALKTEEWANAPEFVPKAKQSPTSYAGAVRNGEHEENGKKKLCPYAEKDGYCKFPPGECSYLHGNICDLCGRAALHPHSEELSKKHTQECISQHERDMELSFAVARSKEKSCGVCFEVIMEKTSGEQRFGILPNCNHCFCLSCIRKWRQARQFENKIIRACPECRVTSDFVCPSMYWVDTKEEKEKLIKDYKEALSTKDCKYFKQGRGKCPFGNKCFYLHALPDGTKTDVGPPPRQRRNLYNGDLEMLQRIILWDYLDERDNNRWLYSLSEDLEDLVALFSDSDDSDWSDYELFLD